LAGTQHIQIYNNIFAASRANLGKPIYLSFSNSQNNGDIMIANNTFVNTLYGVRLGDGTTASTYASSKIVNNAFYNCVEDIIIASIPSWANDAAFMYDYNLIYHTAGGANVDWQTSTPGVFANYTTFNGQWATDHPTLAHNAIGNPLFVSGSDYHLQSGSPAIHAGLDLSGDFTTDMEGNIRSGAWDIGAYEYVSGDTTPPANPSGLSVS